MTSAFGYSLRAGVAKYQISSRSDKMQKIPCSVRIWYEKEWRVCSPPVQSNGQLPGLETESARSSAAAAGSSLPRLVCIVGTSPSLLYGPSLSLWSAHWCLGRSETCCRSKYVYKLC